MRSMKQTFRYKKERKKAFRCNPPGTYSYSDGNDKAPYVVAAVLFFIIFLASFYKGG